MLKVTHMWEGILNLLSTGFMNYLELIFMYIRTLPIKLSPLIFFFHSSFPLSFYMLTFRKTVFLFPVSILCVEVNNQEELFSDSLPSQLQLQFFKELQAQRLQEVVTQFNYLHPPVPGAQSFPKFCLA